jgi:hypothetical protein
MGETIKLRIKDFAKIPPGLAGDPGAARYIWKLIRKKKLPFPAEKIGKCWYVEVDRRAVPQEIREEVEARMKVLKTDKRNITVYIPKSFCNKFRLQLIKDAWDPFLATLCGKDIQEQYFVKKRLRLTIPEGLEKLVDNRHIAMMFLAYVFENYIKEVNKNANSSTSTFPPGGGGPDLQTSRREDAGGTE